MLSKNEMKGALAINAAYFAKGALAEMVRSPDTITPETIQHLLEKMDERIERFEGVE
jgi:hypothetical protein